LAGQQVSLWLDVHNKSAVKKIAEKQEDPMNNFASFHEAMEARYFLAKVQLLWEEPKTCGLYYKTITIIILMIVSDATIWSVTYDRN
jgi:hypothetical protein